VPLKGAPQAPRLRHIARDQEARLIGFAIKSMDVFWTVTHFCSLPFFAELIFMGGFLLTFLPTCFLNAASVANYSRSSLCGILCLLGRPVDLKSNFNNNDQFVLYKNPSK